MTSKERLMCALHREKPDRLPVTVHQWQGYHLDTVSQRGHTSRGVQEVRDGCGCPVF